jgi:hypothetical protein
MIDFIDSTSDSRTINNVMRHQYRILSDDEKSNMEEIKNLGLDFWDALGKLGETGESRELDIARGKIEEAVMWAVKHITK